MSDKVSAECPVCETRFDGWHECRFGDDRVSFRCSDCGEHVHRVRNQMDIDGLAPGRCVTCTLEQMARRDR